MLRRGTLWRLAAVLLGIGGLLLCVGVVSPLRINNDAVRLLLLADSFHRTGAFLMAGEQDQFGHGYPWAVALLWSLGWAHPAGLVGLNLVGFALGGWAFLRFGEIPEAQREWAMVGLLGTVFSWVTIKHLPVPLTEPLYFGLSLCALAVLMRAARETSTACFTAWWVAAGGLALAAIWVRTIGLSLLPVWGGVLVAHLLRGRDWRISRRQGGIALAVFALGLAGALWWVPQTAWFESQFLAPMSYFQQFLVRLGEQVEVIEVLHFRAFEFAEILLNLPLSTASGQWSGAAGVYLLIGYGGIAALLGALGWGWRTMPVMGGYLLAYLLFLFIWPYTDARFWSPVLPLVFVFLARAVGRILAGPAKPWPVLRCLPWAYAAVFLALGLLAMAYSTRLSLSGAAFPARFGGGSQAAAFAAARSDLPDDKLPLTALAIRRYEGGAEKTGADGESD